MAGANLQPSTFPFHLFTLSPFHPFTPSCFFPLVVAVCIAASQCRFSSPFGKTKLLRGTIAPTKLQMSKESGS